MEPNNEDAYVIETHYIDEDEDILEDEFKFIEDEGDDDDFFLENDLDEDLETALATIDISKKVTYRCSISLK